MHTKVFLPVFGSCFVLSLLGCQTLEVDTSSSPYSQALVGGQIRIVSANLTSGRYQKYDPGHGSRILSGLDADIVLLQEFNFGNNSDSAIQSWVDETFSSGSDVDVSYTRESGAQIPNGIVSRFPILDSGVWSDPHINNRNFSWAQIDVPGDVDLWAVSVHLKASDVSRRVKQANTLVSLVEQHIPPDDLLVLGGDLNASNHTEKPLQILAEVVDPKAPWPVDHNGVDGTNRSRSKPYDQILVDFDLQAFQVSSVIGESEFANGAVIDTRVFENLDDIAPALVSDSAAENMQHMAIVKDFDLFGETNGGGEPECSPTSEICNELDDDCDGDIDEGLDCTISEEQDARVVLSEVQFGSNQSASDEFVELYNAGDQELAIGGWKVQYRSRNGSTWSTRATLPDGAQLAARSFYLLASSNYQGTVTADTGNWNNGFSQKGGHVRILDTNDSEVDKLGWGTANSPEGAAIAASNSNGSFQRKAFADSTADDLGDGGEDQYSGNGFDSEDNSSDFVFCPTPTPQNSNSSSELVSN